MAKRDDTRITLGAQSVVCQDNTIKGDVSIGDGTVVHPQARIHALNGPIVIGANNIIEELVSMTNKSSQPLQIGNGNHFEVGAIIESSRIGNNNIFESRSSVLGSTAVADNCVVAAGITTRDTILRDGTILYGDGKGEAKTRRRMESDTSGMALHEMHLQYLRETLPRFMSTRH